MKEDLQQLRQTAENLGLKVDKRWKEARLKQEIEAVRDDGLNKHEPDEVVEAPVEIEEIVAVVESKEAEPPSAFVVKNVSSNLFVCGDFVCSPGKEIELSEKQMNNVRLMRVIKRQLDIGHFKLVTDGSN